MARGRKKAVLTLSLPEREELERWSRRPTSAQALAQRARIVLLAAEGLTNTAVAERLGVTHVTVGKWRARFVTRRTDGLLERLVAPFVSGRGTPPDDCTRHLPYFKTLKIFAAPKEKRPAMMAPPNQARNCSK